MKAGDVQSFHCGTCVVDFALSFEPESPDARPDLPVVCCPWCAARIAPKGALWRQSGRKN